VRVRMHARTHKTLVIYQNKSTKYAIKSTQCFKCLSYGTTINLGFVLINSICINWIWGFND